jgi:hypothetical protein
MIRPKRERENISTTFSKVVRYFSMLMTLVYAAAGLFIIFADERRLNLDMPDTAKNILGGTLILYGIVRFVRTYQQQKQQKHGRFED